MFASCQVASPRSITLLMPAHRAMWPSGADRSPATPPPPAAWGGPSRRGPTCCSAPDPPAAAPSASTSPAGDRGPMTRAPPSGRPACRRPRWPRDRSVRSALCCNTAATQCKRTRDSLKQHPLACDEHTCTLAAARMQEQEQTANPALCISRSERCRQSLIR